MKLEDNLCDLGRASDMLKIPSIGLDLVTSICGDFIGSGATRSVFNYNLDDRFVVKIEPLNSNCNMVEYLIWEEVKGLMGELEWVKNWFAPVQWISPNGRVLVMRKTKPHDWKKDRPEKVPKFLWDVKPENFGWIGKNYVCHDYGQFYNMIKYRKKLVKADWGAFS